MFRLFLGRVTAAGGVDLRTTNIATLLALDSGGTSLKTAVSSSATLLGLDGSSSGVKTAIASIAAALVFDVATSGAPASGVTIAAEFPIDVASAAQKIAVIGLASGLDLNTALSAVKIGIAQAVSGLDLFASSAGGPAPAGGTGATAAEIWGYEIAPGLTAGAALLAVYTKVADLWDFDGHNPAAPLVNADGSRSSGAKTQTVEEAGPVVTVTRTA